MRFYTVSDDYVEYLRTIDHKVPHNKGDDGQKKTSLCWHYLRCRWA
ncbi:hypothetical protein HJ160_22420 [Vibrio parahaemolyticus]|nr:hypothetical protein [Vibrio parahaemolyticus]